MMEPIKSKQKYYEQFIKTKLENDIGKRIVESSQVIFEKALNNALENKKFEIEMYWKRTNYFWALTAVAIAGYFSLLKDGQFPTDDNSPAYLITCIGLVFSLGWYLVNRGSKYWQRNWELHVDLLEDKVYGPLYKLNLNPTQCSFWNLIEAYRFSVSRLNQLLSLFVVIFWLYLFISPMINIKDTHTPIFIITILFISSLLFSARRKRNTNTKINFNLRENKE